MHLSARPYAVLPLRGECAVMTDATQEIDREACSVEFDEQKRKDTNGIEKSREADDVAAGPFGKEILLISGMSASGIT